MLQSREPRQHANRSRYVVYAHKKHRYLLETTKSEHIHTLHIYFSLATSFQHENYTKIIFTLCQFESKSGMYHS